MICLDQKISQLFDENDRDIATSGLCGTFALVLCEYLNSIGVQASPAIVHVGPVTEMKNISWRHVVVKVENKFFDVEGEVLENDVIENYCWGTLSSINGILSITIEDLKTVLKSTKNSYCSRYDKKWKEKLNA